MQLSLEIGIKEVVSEFVKDVGVWIPEFTSNIQTFYSKRTKIKTLSLFSGAGGLDIGFHDAGFEIVESVEVEKVFAETLKQNTGEGKYFEGCTVNCTDVREYDLDDDIDFIIGGPPCQTFSAAGRRASGVAGTTDDRGTLFLEYVRLLKKLSPVGFVFENVYGILGAQKGEDWKQIVKEFSEAGYKLHYRILDAADYGVPQHRERLLIVGLKEGNYKFPRPTHGPDSLNKLNHYSAEESLKGVKISTSKKTGLNGEFGHLLNDIPPGLNYSFYTEKMGHPNPIFAWRSKFSDFLYKADNTRPVRTIKAQGGQYTGPFHWDSRPFTVDEFKRLQTFPDEYEIYGGRGKIIHQIGNSVPPQLARVLAISIKDQVFKQGKPIDMDYLGDFEELSFRKIKRKLTATYAEKAKTAIEKLYTSENHTKKNIQHNEEIFNFSEKLTIEPDENGKYKGHITSNGQKVEVRIDNFKNGQWKKLSISPTGNWSLNESEITITWNGDKLADYVVAWKFFERQLRKQNIKSDLVQLAGYYQYSTGININWCNISESITGEYRILKKLTSDGYTRKIVDKEILFELIQTEGLEPTSFLKKLKKLGVDVRNSNTNSTIEANKYLIPYEFPTLYHKSVQFSKDL
tara:strand:- start:1161 stop:3047 length:1887 start_codon:yes stop_codon:yes gene_type:complete